MAGEKSAGSGSGSGSASAIRRAWVVMGVAGCGKSTVAPRLCAALAEPDAVFIEGDDHHPAGNVAKMSRGEPLTDEDRKPWLDDLAMKMREAAAAGCSTTTSNVVVACSALKRTHRARLVEGATTTTTAIGTTTGGDAAKTTAAAAAAAATGRLPPPPPLEEVYFLHLDVSRRALEERLEERARRGDHFFAPSLLQSQLDTLEVEVQKSADEDDEVARVVRIAADGLDVEQVVAAATEAARGLIVASSSSSARVAPPRLDPSTLEADVGRFLDEWWEGLRAVGLHVAIEGCEIDHVCWRCSTEEEYDAAILALTAAGHAVAGSSVIGGAARACLFTSPHTMRDTSEVK